MMKKEPPTIKMDESRSPVIITRENRSIVATAAATAGAVPMVGPLKKDANRVCQSTEKLFANVRLIAVFHCQSVACVSCPVLSCIYLPPSPCRSCMD